MNCKADRFWIHHDVSFLPTSSFPSQYWATSCCACLLLLVLCFNAGCGRALLTEVSDLHDGNFVLFSALGALVPPKAQDIMQSILRSDSCPTIID